MGRGPNFGDESPGFCHFAMLQVVILQDIAKVVRDKTSRLLVETYDERDPKFTQVIQLSKNTGLSGERVF